MARQRDFWTDIENAKSEARKAMCEQGWKILPSADALRNAGYGALVGAISTHYGGFTKFRQELGQDSERKEEGFWQDIDKVIEYAQNLIAENGWNKFPSSNTLEKIGHGSLVKAIGFHGGFHSFRKKIGQISLRREKGLWKDVQYTIEQSIVVMKKMRWEDLPSTVALRNEGYHNLAGAIDRYHGGMPVFRNKVREITGYIPLVESRDHFLAFLKQNKPAQNLVVLATSLQEQTPELERIITELYPDRFEDLNSLHNLIQKNRENILQLIRDGATDLGAYLGNCTSEDRSIIPLMIGKAFESIGQDIPPSLEGLVYGIFKQTYSPHFNKNPQKTMEDLKGRIGETEGVIRRVYEKLHDHYSSVLQLEEVLA